MHALLGSKHAIGVVSTHGKRGAIDADALGGRGVVYRDLPATALTIAQVHVEEHVAPVLRLETALSGRHAHDGVAVVELARKPARKL